MRRTPKILVVYCHPNAKSYTHAVYQSVLTGLGEVRCDVQSIDLHAEQFDPVLRVDEEHRRRDLDKVEYTARHRALIAWCDAMVFVYPVWWGGFPSMLKGFIDRTFVSGLTYSFQGLPKDAVLPNGLMRGKEAHFFYTLDSPSLVAWIDPGWLSNYLSVFRYCGFSVVRRYYLARLKLSTAERRERWLREAQRHARSIAEQLAAH